MKKQVLLVLVVLFAALALTACGGGTDTSNSGSGGDVKAGETLFAKTVVGAQAGCITCHSLQANTVIVGPSMAGIGTTAATRVSGLSAEAYIRQSILHPNDYIVEGFQPNIMVQVWEDELTAAQVDDLVAYLLTLK